MPGNEFSPQDVQDLQKIAEQLPTGHPTAAKIMRALVPYPSDTQAAAEKLTGGLISPSGLAAPTMPLRNESVAPRRTRDISTGRPVERVVPRTGEVGGMEESDVPQLVRTSVNTALPALGGIAGTTIAAPTVAGTALGAGIGTGLGVEGAQLLNRGIFGESKTDPNPASPAALKDMALQSLTAAGSTGIIAGLSGAPLTTPKAAPPMQVFGPSEESAEMNEIIGAKPKQIRISKGAQDIGDAATNPGRGLRAEGFESQQVQNMTPVERMAAIKPKYDAAGAAIDDLVSKATAAKKIVDVGKTATGTLDKIADPKLQERAIESFNSLAKELDIPNLRTATPEDALKLRRALGGGARFGPNGDLSSLAGVRAALYRSVNTDLRAVVPGLQPLDQHFSDLNAAIEAVQQQVGKAAVKGPLPLPSGPGPGPGILGQTGRAVAQGGASMLLKKALPYAGGPVAGAMGNALYEGLKRRFLP